MAWQEVIEVGRKRGFEEVGFTYSGTYGGRIVLPASVWRRIGLKPDGHVRVFFGSGAEEGKIRIQAGSGPFIARKTTGSPLWIHLGKVPQLVDRARLRVSCEFVCSAEAVVVTLPTGTAAAQSAPQRPQIAAVTPPANGSLQKQDVTTRIMGRDGNGGRPISRAPGA